VYLAYRHLVAAVNPVRGAGLEDKLKALDELLLGVSPSFALQHIASPWLTELMAYAYALMFVLPLLVMVILFARERWDEFRAVGVSVLVAFFAGLALYLLVPARSPRLVYGYDVELRGVFGLYEASTRVWDKLQTVQYDAFPSLHTAISTIALYWARRSGGKALFWIYLPHVILLQIATLYLRQHYFVDLVGGWTLAAGVLWLNPRIVGVVAPGAAYAR
jgi:membrane-associated phospholipid phosphatase